MDETTNLNELVPGYYDMTCQERPGVLQYWEFTKDGKALQDGMERGTWTLLDGVVVIKHAWTGRGHIVLTFEDENTLVGENLWRGNRHLEHWNLVRVKP